MAEDMLSIGDLQDRRLVNRSVCSLKRLREILSRLSSQAHLRPNWSKHICIRMLIPARKDSRPKGKAIFAMRGCCSHSRHVPIQTLAKSKQ
jgi:hypothetical protein